MAATGTLFFFSAVLGALVLAPFPRARRIDFFLSGDPPPPLFFFFFDLLFSFETGFSLEEVFR